MKPTKMKPTNTQSIYIYLVTLHNANSCPNRTTGVTAKEHGREGDYVFGANSAGFVKVATDMRAQDIV